MFQTSRKQHKIINFFMRSPLWSIFMLSLIIRLTALAVLPYDKLSSNAKLAFLGGAQMLLHGEGFSDPSYPMMIPPVTAVIIALTQLIFGNTVLPFKIIQCFLGSVTVIFFYRIFLDLWGKNIATLASIFLATYPFSILTVTYIGSETIFIFFFSLYLTIFTRAINTDNGILFFLSGIAIGLATLTRGTTQFYLLFIFTFFYIFRFRPAPILFRQFMITFIAFILTLAPWVFRNYSVLQAFLPTSTSGIVMLHGADQKHFIIKNRRQVYTQLFDSMEKKGIPRPPNNDWIKKHQFYKKVAIEIYKNRISNEPLSFFPLILTKFIRLWYGTESGNNELLILILNSLLYFLSICGFILAFIEGNKNHYILFASVFYYIMLHWAVFSLFRFMLPLIPILIGYSSLSLYACYKKYFQHKIYKS